jgi:hypothetical protein
MDCPAGNIMRTRTATCNFIAAFLLLTTCASAGAETPKIGVTAAVKNDVQGFRGSIARPLSAGSDVFTNEGIRTGEASLAQILFLDKTSLTVGPRAELTLDRFVYNPSKGTGQVVLNAVQGAFRFVTGSQNPRNYTIKTPVGTLGVRGSIVEGVVERIQLENGQVQTQVIIVLVEGSITITVNKVQYTLTIPGTAYKFIAGGGAQGPFAWDSTSINAASDVSLPMYGWYILGNPLDNGLPELNIGGIDQLNGIIQQSLTPPPAPPQQIN